MKGKPLMYKPFPFYIPCRQATSEEVITLQDYLIRDLKTKVDMKLARLEEEGRLDQNGCLINDEDDEGLIMEHEVATYETCDLTLDSIIVVFDWQYYQTSNLVPRHDYKPQLPKVMCVFWHGKPDDGELFTWERDGAFHRLVCGYNPEKQIEEQNWKTSNYLL
jgi:hypothetical protein